MCSPLIDDAISTIRPLVAKNGNRLEVACAGSLGAMLGDQTRVRQVLFNLLSNACKFTENGLIRLEARRIRRKGSDWVEFRVADTGIGMSPDQLDRLYRPFMQADASTTRKYGGTGLGLAISREFCQMMGGTSERRERIGQRVGVHRPAAGRSGRAGGAAGRRRRSCGEAAGACLRSWSSKITNGAATCWSGVFRGVDTRSSRRADGRRGIAMAREQSPDLIVMDMSLPEIDGWEATRRLKADPATRGIPIVALTAHAMASDRKKAMDAGCDDYHTKPVDFESLRAQPRKLFWKPRKSLALPRIIPRRLARRNPAAA